MGGLCHSLSTACAVHSRATRSCSRAICSILPTLPELPVLLCRLSNCCPDCLESRFRIRRRHRRRRDLPCATFQIQTPLPLSPNPDHSMHPVSYVDMVTGAADVPRLHMARFFFICVASSSDMQGGRVRRISGAFLRWICSARDNSIGGGVGLRETKFECETANSGRRGEERRECMDSER